MRSMHSDSLSQLTHIQFSLETGCTVTCEALVVLEEAQLKVKGVSGHRRQTSNPASVNFSISVLLTQCAIAM